MPILFFLHIPKCAGMSLTNALLDRLDAGEIYQSTSLVRNFRENRPEFPQITDHKRLRAVVGHWVHESMLPVLRKPILFATSLRDPVQRIRSQYRFDIGMRGENWRPSSPETFLQNNRNVIVSFLTRAFPTIAARHGDPVEGCKAVLSGMDCVFDVADADHWLPELVRTVIDDGLPVARANESARVDAELPCSDDEIAAHCDQDLRVHEWFASARAARPEARNPVLDKDMRAEFASLGSRPFAPDILSEYLAPKIANEIRNDIEDPERALAKLQNATGFALALERALQRSLRAT